MKRKFRRIAVTLISALLISSLSLSSAMAYNESNVTDEPNERISVNFTLDEFILSAEQQGFEVEILDSTFTPASLFSQRSINSTRIKITRNLPPDIVTPFGDPIPGKGYIIANYEEENLTGIAYPYFVSVVGLGIELNSGQYAYESHYADYNFTNGNFSVEWYGSGQFTYTTSTSVGVGFDWFSVSYGDSYIYRSPAYGWEFRYDFPQPV